MTEDQLSKINHGKSASLAYNHLKPLIEARRLSAITQMKHDYRLGNFNADKQRSLVAELIVLDDLEASLRGEINLGNKALKNTQE